MCAASSTPLAVPTDWDLENGAASGASKLPGESDIRSGGPGQTALALVAHPLFSEGHLITGATVSFQVHTQPPHRNSISRDDL